MAPNDRHWSSFFSCLGFLSVGYLHTEPCERSERLERSITSLLSNMDKFSLEQLSIIIVLRNCSAECTSQFLKRIKLNYDHLLRLKVLKIIKPGVRHITTDLKSKYWENLTSYNTNYVNKAKSLVADMAFLWKYSFKESRYFIQFTDHIIVEGNIVSHLLDNVKTLIDPWLWADNVKGALSGRFYQTKAFPAMIEYMDLFGNQIPVNLILNFYRQFRYSHQAINISPPLPLREDYYFIADNPPARLTTSLIYGGGYSLQDIYNTKRGYFWAKTPQKGDYIIIEMRNAVKINRILIETGSHLDEDIIPGGSLSVVFHQETLSTAKVDCYSSQYTKLADFRAPSLNLHMQKMTVKCIKVVVTPIPFKDLQFWVIFKTIAVFTDDVNKV